MQNLYYMGSLPAPCKTYEASLSSHCLDRHCVFVMCLGFCICAQPKGDGYWSRRQRGCKPGRWWELNVSLLPGSAFGKGAAALSYLMQTQGIRGGRQGGFQGREPPTHGREERFTSDIRETEVGAQGEIFFLPFCCFATCWGSSTLFSSWTMPSSHHMQRQKNVSFAVLYYQLVQCRDNCTGCSVPEKRRWILIKIGLQGISFLLKNGSELVSHLLNIHKNNKIKTVKTE